jgi:hypothetical protein
MFYHEKKFYSYKPLLRFYAKFTVIFSGVFLFSALIGQWFAGRLPNYTDLAFATLIPLVAFVVIATLILSSDVLYPLKVSPKGLVSYNRLGRYCLVSWDQIIAVHNGEKLGMKCLYLETRVFKPYFIVPLWLHEFDDFCRTVEYHAGSDNPLTIALKKAIHYTV